MLYVATVHYASPRWIEIQARHLKQHLSVPYQVWTSLEQIDASYSERFDRVLEQRGRHSDKLNHLALEITHEGADDDLLMFLDGDAFPIADPMGMIEAGLSQAPLVAVRRAENAGDRQPHPCFCVTTVKTWRELPGDWSPGYRWPDDKGRLVSDVGGNLLRALELADTPWVEILRSNRVNRDPLFFAIYGDAIYHHGAGFRVEELARGHAPLAPERHAVQKIPGLSRVLGRLSWRRRQAWALETKARHARESEALLERIEQGGTEWLDELR